MLTFAENGWNFKAFKILSTLNLLPIQIDLQTGKIQSQTSKIRIYMWRIYFSLGICHTFYMFLRLVQSTILEPEKYFRWDHFVIHFSLTVDYILFNFVGFQMFVAHSKESEMVLNQLFVERENPVQKMINDELENAVKKEKEINVLGENSGKEVESLAIQETADACTSDSQTIRPLFTWPPQYSLDELLTRLLSFDLVIAAILILLVLAADPSYPQLLYSSLPPEYQNVYSFLGLFSIEVISMTNIFVFCFSLIVTQLLFFGKCQLELQRLHLQLRNLVTTFQSRPDLNRDIRREIWILRQISAEMKELVVFIELFNRCFPFCIFAFKILCLVLSILYYFFAIRHSHDFPFLALFTGYLALVISLEYNILYQNAFSIPEGMEQLKRKFLLSAQKTAKSQPKPENSKLNAFFWADMNREIRRIRNVGVKVGSFHTLERESTPNFIDFVFKNVVDLLVTFP